MHAQRLNERSSSGRAASLFETRVRGSHIFFVLVVWVDARQVRVGIGEIRLAYDGLARTHASQTRPRAS